MDTQARSVERSSCQFNRSSSVLDEQAQPLCRTRPGKPYLASVAVIYTELAKLVICMGAQGGVCWKTSGERGLTFREEMVHQAREIFGRSYPMLVPAALFVMQQVGQHI